MKNQLQDSVIAITGAGSGIGRSLALECARQGAMLAISDINLEALQVTKSQVLAQSPNTDVLIHEINVADKDQVFQWSEDVFAHFGKVNVIINNAGVALSATVEAMQYEDFEWLMDINFWGVVHGCKAFLPHLKKSPWGHIVNVSSLFGLISTPNTSAYNAAKFAVKGFSESLRIELMMTHKQLDLSCVHPGGIKTNIANYARDGGDKVGSAGRMSTQERSDNFNDKFAKTTPEQAAKIIINGIIKKQPRILVGLDAKILDLLQRFLPVKYQKVVKKVFS